MNTQQVPCHPPLAIDVAGQGPLVLLVHGMGGDRSCWHAQMAALQHRFTAVSVDLRGYGDSGDIPAPLDFQRDFSADLAAVMDHFGVARAHLVGLSMGGRVVRAAALAMPQRVASLTLASTSPGFDALQPQQLEAFVASRSQGLADGVLPPGFALAQARQMVAPGARADAIDTAARAMARLRPAQYLQVLRASTLQDRGARLEDLRCPVLVLAGDQDPVYPADVTAQLLARIAGARGVTLAGAGHLSNLEQPQAFNQALLDFLSALPAEPPARHPGGIPAPF